MPPKGKAKDRAKPKAAMFDKKALAGKAAAGRGRGPILPSFRGFSPKYRGGGGGDGDGDGGGEGGGVGGEGAEQVLLKARLGGYGASVAAAWVMAKEDWDTLKAALLADPPVSIDNEALGGRTSDECFSSHELVTQTVEITDPAKVTCFLVVFPEKIFGTDEFFSILDGLVQRSL